MNDFECMNLAINESNKSLDPIKKVGICIVKDDNILSLGYNSPPKGFDKYMVWDKGEGLNNKLLYIVHAEVNAILNCKYDLKNAILYTTFFPCNECAKVIIQSGIKEIVYLDDNYKNKIILESSKMLLDKCKINYRRL